MSCMQCVEVCPVKNTLDMQLSKNTQPVPSWVSGGLVVGTFVAITGLAMLTGNWQNNISKEEYRQRFQQIDSPVYQHNRGSVPHYGPND